MIQGGQLAGSTAYTLVLWLAKNVGFVTAHTVLLTLQYQQTGTVFRKGIRSYQSNDLWPSTQSIIFVIVLFDGMRRKFFIHHCFLLWQSPHWFPHHPMGT